eukprot:UN09870
MEIIWYCIDSFVFSPGQYEMQDIVHKLLHQVYTTDSNNTIDIKYQYHCTTQFVNSNNNINDKVYQQQFKQCYNTFLDEQINTVDIIIENNNNNNNNNNIIYDH